MQTRPSQAERRLVDQLVVHFRLNRRLVSTFLNSLLVAINESEGLKDSIHSIRHRIKDPAHLRDKLFRKIRESKKRGKQFPVTTANLFSKITDLAGIRILHLHTTQIADIDRHLKQIISEQAIKLIEGPFARTWDDESRAFFKLIEIKTQKSDTMYTSVHYVVASTSEIKITCEIQVRTLMEEVWGEVDHSINYPHPSKSVACKEQIRALARSTSSATRLVDAIFATAKDLKKQKTKAKSKRNARRMKAKK